VIGFATRLLCPPSQQNPPSLSQSPDQIPLTQTRFPSYTLYRISLNSSAYQRDKPRLSLNSVSLCIRRISIDADSTFQQQQWKATAAARRDATALTSYLSSAPCVAASTASTTAVAFPISALDSACKSSAFPATNTLCPRAPQSKI
jgi:hypothetical protein